MVWWARAWQALRRLFGWLPEEERWAGDRERRSVPRSGELDPAAFLSMSAGLGRRDGETRLHVLSLSDFRKAAGSKWSKIERLVAAASGQIIRGNLDPATDIYTRLDSEVACVLMPGKDRAAARATVASIAKDLTAGLFGTAVVGGRRPQVVTANLALKDLFSPRAGHPAAAIKTALDESAALLPAEAAPPDVAAAHRATLAAMLPPDEAAALEGAAPFAISGGQRQAERVWQAEGRPMGGELGVMRVEGRPMGGELGVMRAEGRPMGGELGVMRLGERGPRAEEQVFRVERQPSGWVDEQIDEKAQAALDGSRHMGRSSELTLVWTPTWVTSRGGVGCFHARVIRDDGDGGPPLEGVAAYGSAAPIEILALDRFVATQAASELTSLYYDRGHDRAGLTVPIHWMSLAPRWRECIRMPFEPCPPQACRKLLKIEIFGLTPAMPPAILGNLAEPLEKLGCHVLARIPLSAPQMIPALKGVRAVGVDLAELPEDERAGDDEMLRRLAAFRDAARDAGLACYVWSVRRRSLIAGIARAGFSLINGPGVMADLSHPMPLAAFRKKA